MENNEEVKVATEQDCEIRKNYERFARNFDLLDSLYKNQGLSKQKMLEVLQEMHDRLFEFTNSIISNKKYRKMAMDLYAEMHSYIVNVKNDNILQY